MKPKFHQENGAIAIEAVIGLTFFMITIIAIMFMAMVIKVQSTMQYALGQTAKEISGYYYLLDKTGLTKVTAGGNSDKTKNVDEAIGHVIDFSSKTGNAIKEGEEFVSSVTSDELDLTSLPSDIKNIGNQASEVYAAANNLTKDFDTLSEDPAGQLKNIFSVFAKTMTNKALSYYIAPHVCRAIMPRYLAGDKDSSNNMLESMGVKLENKTGLESLDFSQSELLADGRSIKLVVIYKINPEKITMGFVKLPEDKWPVFRQTACTAAWIAPDGKNTLTVKDTANK